MNKTNYPSLTNYLAKTKKNADLYRLYNPQFSFSCKSDTQEQRFYFDYFSRHMVSKRNILTVFSIYTFTSYNMNKKETIKNFIRFLKTTNESTFHNAFSFRGGNILYVSNKNMLKEISWFSLARIYEDIKKIALKLESRGISIPLAKLKTVIEAEAYKKVLDNDNIRIKVN